jgi:hypothetical protein
MPPEFLPNNLGTLPQNYLLVRGINRSILPFAINSPTRTLSISLIADGKVETLLTCSVGALLFVVFLFCLTTKKATAATQIIRNSAPPPTEAPTIF